MACEDKINYRYSDEKRDFYYERKRDEAIRTYNYKLHNHQKYEVYVFLEGHVHYFIEGSLYKLTPCDILVIRDNEMHEAVHVKSSAYNRIVMHFSKNFFVENNCKEYEKIFTDRMLGKENLISAQYVKSSGLLDAFKRFEEYTAEAGSTKRTIAVATLIEILHILNQSTFENNLDTVNNETVREIMKYIGKNLETLSSLDQIADYLFLSKCHICRIFKKVMGMTINKYIISKRIMLVRQLCQNGKSISEAASEAGFGSYSNFYKIYTKETGLPPKEGLKRFVEQGKTNPRPLKD